MENLMLLCLLTSFWCTFFYHLVQPLKRLGKGQYGEVFLVEHKNTHEQYVWKKIKSSLLISNNRIPNSISELVGFNTPFLVRHYAVFNHEGYCYLLMEKCERGSFRRLLNGRKATFSDKV